MKKVQMLAWVMARSDTHITVSASNFPGELIDSLAKEELLITVQEDFAFTDQVME